MTEQLRILHINNHDLGGGAARVAWELHHAQRKRGHDSWLAVGSRRSEEEQILQIPGIATAWKRACEGMRGKLAPFEREVKGVWRLISLLKTWSVPQRAIEDLMGRENFYAPGTYKILSQIGYKPDIIHCHNLQGRYFDLRILPQWSRDIPTVLTMHDPWLLSGHCTHSFECDRWKTGCGACPDLDIFPRITRDGTRRNWNRKRNIYRKSRLYVVGDCSWVHERMKESMLGPAVAGSEVILLGVDLSLFKPRDKTDIRKQMGLPLDRPVLLFAASTIKRNQWKDYLTMQEAVKLVGERLGTGRILFMALGEQAEPIMEENYEIRFFPYETDPVVVAGFYQASDLYLHAARAETFPQAPIESLACGTPVIATAIGGIPEGIKGLRNGEDGIDGDSNTYPEQEATGVLVPLGNARAMAGAIMKLISDNPLRIRLGENARKDCVSRFDQERVVNQYLALYRSLIGSRSSIG
ncbi:glycosyltransferase [Fibrobacterota bacterium]